MRSLRLSESRGNACIHFAEREQARPEVNLGEAHRKHSFQLMANELKMSHIIVSLIFAGLQLLINLGFVYLCPNTVLAHWLFLMGVFFGFGALNLCFRKKYYHLHEEYLASLKK